MKDDIKVYISYGFSKKNSGGGNQFLLALRSELNKLKKITKNLMFSNIILFNSHQNKYKVIFYKYIFKKKKFIHRVDGPISKYMGKFDNRDLIVEILNKYVADGTVYQSLWSKNNSSGICGNSPDIVIPNFPNGDIFKFCTKKNVIKNNKKINLVTVSWSSNINKGFEYLRWLDENLNFNEISYKFVGNSLYKFRNIKNLGVLKSEDVADVLRESDIFISGSKIEASSNSIIEAIYCGVPVIAFNESSNPEVINGNGILINNYEETKVAINEIMKNYDYYVDKNIHVNSAKITMKYLNFFRYIYGQKEIKKITLIDLLKFYLAIINIKKS